MDEDELRQELMALSDPEPEPEVVSDEELRMRLEEIDPKPPVDIEEEEEAIRQQGILAEVPTTGELVVRYDNAIVERDEAGRIIGVVGNGWRKTVVRDTMGRVVSISTETEEVVETEIPSEDEDDEEASDDDE